MASLKPKKFFGHGSIASLKENGFGFIESKNFENDLFFHRNELMNAEFEGLRAGDEVGFEIIERKQGPIAINVAKNGFPQVEEQKDNKSLVENSKVRVSITNLAQSLVVAVANKPTALDEIEWRDLERLLAEAIAGLGIEVELTPGSKDGGRDLELKFMDGDQKITVLVEIKHWRSSKTVGIGPVSEFLHVIAREGSSAGLFLSTSGYSNNIAQHLTEFDRRKLGLGTEEKVVSLCRNYVRAKGGNWYPPDDLFKAVYEDTDWSFDEQ